MNPDQQRYLKRAIAEHGIRVSSNVLWFIDDGITHFGIEQTGEIIDYLSGYVSGNTFVASYSTRNENLDSIGWNTFITAHLELSLIDARQ